MLRKDLLRQNYILIKEEKFKELDRTEKSFFANFFEIRRHKRFDNVFIFKKRPKYIDAYFDI